MKSLPDHKRRMIESQQRTNHIKRKRTSGYAVFCSEYRRKCQVSSADLKIIVLLIKMENNLHQNPILKLQAEDPQLAFSEISKKVAEEWRVIPNEKKRNYEARAQRYNQEEDRKWRQRMAAQQRSRGVPLQPGQMGQMGQRGGRGGGVPVQGRGQMYRHIAPKRGGYSSQTAAQLASQTGLVISSVSSLSTQNNTFNLPKVTLGMFSTHRKRQ